MNYIHNKLTHLLSYGLLKLNLLLWKITSLSFQGFIGVKIPTLTLRLVHLPIVTCMWGHTTHAHDKDQNQRLKSSHETIVLSRPVLPVQVRLPAAKVPPSSEHPAVRGRNFSDSGWLTPRPPILGKTHTEKVEEWQINKIKKTWGWKRQGEV